MALKADLPRFVLLKSMKKNSAFLCFIHVHVSDHIYSNNIQKYISVDNAKLLCLLLHQRL